MLPKRAKYWSNSGTLLRKPTSRRPVSPIHLGLGEVDEALLWMDRAIDAQDPMMTSIKTYPFLDPLRSDPRFTGLLRKMKLEF
jgi:hypothetical protein